MKPTDTQILDWLQKQLDKETYTGRCVYRQSPYGRGWRLHETTRSGSSTDVRQAIILAMMKER